MKSNRNQYKPTQKREREEKEEMGKREKVSSFRIVGHFNFYESDFCPQAGKLGSIALDSFAAMWTGPGASKQMSRKKAAAATRTVLENREREGERERGRARETGNIVAPAVLRIEGPFRCCCCCFSCA